MTNQLPNQSVAGARKKAPQKPVKKRRRYLRWILAVLVFIVVIVLLAVGWVIGTDSGTQWTLRTVATQLNGHAQGMKGNLWKGLEVESFGIDLPSVKVDANQISLKIRWMDLLQGAAHVEHATVDKVAVELRDTNEPEEPSSDEPITLPIKVLADHVAVNQFELTKNKESLLPVQASQFKAEHFVWDDKGIKVDLTQLNVDNADVSSQLAGTFGMAKVGTPWPMDVQLHADAHGQGEKSPLCIAPLLGLPQSASTPCDLTANVNAKGDLNQLGVKLDVSGQDLALTADADLPLSQVVPLNKAHVQLDYEKENKLLLDLGKEGDHVKGTLKTKNLPLDSILKNSHFGSDLAIDIALNAEQWPKYVTLTGQIDPSSRWGGQVLNGDMDIAVDLDKAFKTEDKVVQTEDKASKPESKVAQTEDKASKPESKVVQTEDKASETESKSEQPSYTYDWTKILLPKLNGHIKLGNNTLSSQGAFGLDSDHLEVDIKGDQLKQIWPDIPGQLQSDMKVKGGLAHNQLDLNLKFTQGKSQEIGKAPVELHYSAAGGWGEIEKGILGWEGTVLKLDAEHAGFSVKQVTPLKIVFAPTGHYDKPEWIVGAAKIDLGLPNKHTINIVHNGSNGQGETWETEGLIKGLVVSPAMIKEIKQALAVSTDDEQTIIVNSSIKKASVTDPVLDLNWNLHFDQGLKGEITLDRKSGDFLVPTEPPVPMGLRNLNVVIKSTPLQEGHSRVDADVTIKTESKIALQAKAQVQLNGLSPDLNTAKANVKGTLDDISWVSAFTKDMVDLGGRIDLDVSVSSKAGFWTSNGRIQGKGLKIVEVENGIRLLDGTMNIALQGDNVRIDQLHFPGVIRVMPTEWRTKKWIEDTPAARNGSLDIKGNWNIKNSQGKINVVMDHYPVMQRSDRFAMMSGQVNVVAALPKLAVKGKMVADAGWASVDIQGGVPSVDSDVVILQPGDEKEKIKAETGIDLDLDFGVDLGPRFYIVGLGLDSGLRGGINIKQQENRLTAVGEFNTRGGAVDAYGQHLQIRRGSISFQGNIANPVLNIEAIRNGLEVEAGVRVVGTAKKPKITLVSYPDVSDIEKLSWLIMGRGPDSNGGDLALLFSVGSSIVGGGDPFYKKLGIDEWAIRTGDVGESSSMLPTKTVADSIYYDSQSDISSQFLAVGKKLSTGIMASIEQSLTGTGTVARVSYKLLDYLSADAKVGTVNGLELIYKRAFKD